MVLHRFYKTGLLGVFLGTCDFLISFFWVYYIVSEVSTIQISVFVLGLFLC